MKETAPHATKVQSFMSLHLSPRRERELPPIKYRPCVTMSRQTGSGAMAIAAEVATYLQTHSPAPSHWTVFDKNLVATVLEEHKLPKEVAKFMPEDHVSAVQDAVEEMLGLHPSSRTLWQQTAETILHLAELGHVIIIGRASNVITANLPNAFHVRLIAPLDYRVQQIMTRNRLDEKAAREFIHKHDHARHRYVRDHFNQPIDDPMLYDLIVNTARLPQSVVANLIGSAVIQWAETL